MRLALIDAVERHVDRVAKLTGETVEQTIHRMVRRAGKDPDESNEIETFEALLDALEIDLLSRCAANWPEQFRETAETTLDRALAEGQEADIEPDGPEQGRLSRLLMLEELSLVAPGDVGRVMRLVSEHRRSKI